MLTRKIDHTSPLSEFAHNAKSAQMKSIYTKALEEAKKEQLEILREEKEKQKASLA
ncbi:MAG: hypothetical protein MI864_00880 [Pseudomonadales bacterium]|nr:hypothetical protein [Pseudomonadales bacterium]